MLGHQSEEAYRRSAANTLPNELHHRASRDYTRYEYPDETRAELNNTISHDGTWGERDVGGPVDREAAMQDFAELRQGLSRLTRERSTRSKPASRPASRASRATSGRPDGLFKRLSVAVSNAMGDGRQHDQDSEDEGDRDISSSERNSDEDFQLEQFMRDGHLEKRNEAGESTKKVGVVFKNLTVKGVSTGATFVRTLPEAILGTFGPDLYRILGNYIPALRFGRKPELRTLLNNFTGVVRHGEIMLVLGRPGSGCSTFLKVIANNRAGYAAVDGEVHYSGISAEEVAKKYRGEVVYNGEDDLHLPTLTVEQTLKFSLLNKTKKRLRGDMELIVTALLKMFAMSHTRHTIVGDAYVRGVSGGERKRVSIQESLATKSSVVCWDNSTRGLDASTALDYARSLRIMTDVSDRTTITTLYQAGEGIYELMDKVLVIDEGRMLYQGPASRARQYFIDLGFHAPPRQTTPDFLTSICDPNARHFRPGWKDRCPKTAEDLEKAFLASEAYRDVLADVRDYESHLLKTNHADTHAFKESVSSQKSRRVSEESNYTVSFLKQVTACTRREAWLVWGDKQELWTKFFIIVSNALVVSSLFYNSPLDTSGAFMRGGTVFFSIIFLGWLQMSELMKAVSGRAVVGRHRAYAFYRPSAVNLARAIVDFPLLLVQVIIFSLIVYFMTGLDRDPGKFFTYCLLIFTTTYCLTALYRMFAALSPSIDDAVRFAGLALNLVVMYCGYVISKPVMLGEKIWFGWLYHVSPVSYSFEAVLSNDFHGREMQCSPNMLVPQGPGIQQQNQGCTLPGGRPGDDRVNGDAYLAQQFQYTRGHLWRNWGVIIAFAVLYLLVTVLATEKLSFVGGGGGALVFKKSSKTKKNLTLGKGQHDEEKGSSRGSSTDDVGNKTPHGPSRKDIEGTIEKSQKVFTWENVTYTVPTPQGPKRLLNKVSGYAKPGVMVALMGASGAGKTTLLNTLSQRQTVGVVTGDMLVDNKPLGTDFQRSTGFVEQMDLHDESTTIREALEFSALLRQSRDIPRAEKLAYVDSIINLLELEDIQDAIICSLGVEQKKRLTIGVELAAKPSLLLFLDEPTSGLDSQSAMSIVRFLRKLCAAGQAIVCTIHQPSSDLIQEFDKILALNPGGNVFYFGPVGENGSSVVNYFAARGVECPPGKNVAEFLLETAAKPHRRVDEDGKSRRVHWATEWKESDEYRQVLTEINQIKKGRTLAAQLTLSNNQPQPIQHEFAATIPTQAWLLTKRMFIRQWRDPSYLYGRLFISLVMGIFNGFTYYKISSPRHDSSPLSLTELQNTLFTAFLIIMIPTTVLNAVLPKFYMSRSLWEAREHPSRIYGWVAFCTAEILSEIPGSLVAGTIYFLAWYLPTGLPRGTAGSAEAEAAVYVWLMSVSFMLFIASWGQWICAFAPSFAVITNVLPFFLVIFCLFNGVVVPWEQMNVAWKWWLYYLNPATYWIGGIMAAVLRKQTVHCADGEMAVFRPPVGESCRGFAGSWLSGVARRGYLTTLGVVDDQGGFECGYCPYADGEEYLASLNVRSGQMWRDFGIFAGFCVANWALVYFFIYTVRVKGWSFGFGFVGRMVGAVVGTIKESVEGLFGGKKEEEKEGEKN